MAGARKGTKRSASRRIKSPTVHSRGGRVPAPPARTSPKRLRATQTGTWRRPIIRQSLQDVAARLRFVAVSTTQRSQASGWGFVVQPWTVLVAWAAGFLWHGCGGLVGSAMDPLPATMVMTAVLALMLTAVGPSVPVRLASWLTPMTTRKNAAGQAGHARTFWMFRAVHERDEPLLWLVLATLASMAGGAILLTLAWSGPLLQVYGWFCDQFLWNPLTFSILEWVTVGVLIAPAWIALGMVLALLPTIWASGNRLSVQAGGVLINLLLALGAGWLVQKYLLSCGLSASRCLLIAAMLMFVLAVVCAFAGRRGERNRLAPIEAERHAPEERRFSVALTWCSLVVWGIAVALVAVGWLGCQTRLGGIFEAGSYILALGIGAAVALFYARRRWVSDSLCSMVLWIAGLGVSGAVTLLAFWSHSSLGGWLQLVLIAMPMGFALYCIERAWLGRVGSQMMGFAQLCSAVLGGLAVGFIAGQWWAVRSLGSMGTICAGALLVIAVGGLMQVYEQDYPSHVHRRRLAWIFASLAVVIVLFPLNVRQWHVCLQRTAANRGPMMAAPADLSFAHFACVIGEPPANLLNWNWPAGVRVDCLALEEGFACSLPRTSRWQVRTFSWPAMHYLRLQPFHYDLIVQGQTSDTAIPAHVQYSREWLDCLKERTARGGRVMVAVSLTRWSERGIAVIATTFAQVMGDSAVVSFSPDRENPTMLLQAYPWMDRWPASREPVRRLHDWLSHPEQSSIHSIQCDRLSPFLNPRKKHPLSD